jgi:hypothetical protein
MISKKKTKKPTKRTKLQPLTEFETFNLPCGAMIEIIGVSVFSSHEPARRSLINLRIKSSTGLARENNISVKEINLGFYGQNIPDLIKILRRAYLVK